MGVSTPERRMRRRLAMRPSRLLLVAAAGTALLAGCATSAPAPARLTEPVAAKAQAPDPYCVRDTGKRLQPAGGRCLPSPGRVITREEIDQTGRTSVDEVLNTLVPR
jgi:hypothetical protein